MENPNFDRSSVVINDTLQSFQNTPSVQAKISRAEESLKEAFSKKVSKSSEESIADTNKPVVHC